MRNRTLPSLLPVAGLAQCALLALTACEEPGVTFHRDVKPILDQRCASCHVEGGIAPFALASYQDVEPIKDLVVGAVEAGTMPPWFAGPDCSTYGNDPSVTDDEKAVLRAWLDLGAPEGAPLDAPTQVEQAQELSRIDLELAMPEPYSPRTDQPDDYHCFVVDWPETTEKFVTGLGVLPGDTNVVHHVITYVVRPENVADARAADDEEAGPGFTCFGGPRMADEGLGGWAPGTPAREYPAGTGIRVRPGSALIMEVHYHAPGIFSEDLSSLIIKTEDTVEKEAAIIPVTNPTWVDSAAMLIPAGEAEVVHTFTIPLESVVDQPFLIYDATPHMHKRGFAETLWIDRADGTFDCVLDVPKWDFNWQLTYVLSEPKVVYPEDALGITCIWDNSKAQPDDPSGIHDVTWGEGTADEMCLGFYFVTKL